jgi:prepilin-type N-terminal cleavage/methylation domain-containing protein
VRSQKSEVRSQKSGPVAPGSARYCNHGRRKTKAWRVGPEAFTLIELLVAMAILVIIVLIVTKVFAQATAAWTAGSRRAEMNMTGRAVADFIAQDLSQAVSSSNYPFNVTAISATFWIIGDATNSTYSAREVQYTFGVSTVTRSETPSTQPQPQTLCDNLQPGSGFDPPATVLPPYVDIRVAVSDGNVSNKVFQSRAAFPNRNRYQY